MEVFRMYSLEIFFYPSTGYMAGREEEIKINSDLNFVYHMAASLIRYHKDAYHISIKKYGKTFFHVRKSKRTGKIVISRVSDNKRIFY